MLTARLTEHARPQSAKNPRKFNDDKNEIRKWARDRKRQLAREGQTELVCDQP